jgi:4-amino-4-deoxy-L-arabinose transferase-like glycosyltransferase
MTAHLMIEVTGAPAPNRLARLVALGLALRLLAAFAVEWAARRKGSRCLFPDTNIYWELATSLRRGAPYEVSQWGVPHAALRTPGYPGFLAACQTLFGDSTLAARGVQAVIGAGCIVLVHRLVARLTSGTAPATIAAALVAIDPWTVAISALLLSEALFVPWLLLSLWGLATLWTDPRPRRWPLVALATGAAFGAGVLVKPSWALFPPVALAAWMIARRRRSTVIGASLVVVGVVLAMAPWWVRNYRIYGRFVPTALWMGASLYDGLSPGATGASDMRFLETADVRVLDEVTQDAVLTRRASAFARSNPGQVLRLAGIKAGRYWSPWPNAENLRSPLAAIGGLIVTVPIYLLVLAGAWDRRHDPRALVLMLGPLLYFAALHMVFVSSVRYRIPGMVPALGLAGIGWSRIFGGWFPTISRRESS